MRVEQVEADEIDDAVHFFEGELAAERAEEAEESGVGEREKNGVEQTGLAAGGEIGDRDEGGLGVRAIVEGGREIELGLDIDFHALRLPLALREARPRAIADFFFEFDFGGEWEAGLGVVGI